MPALAHRPTRQKEGAGEGIDQPLAATLRGRVDPPVHYVVVRKKHVPKLMCKGQSAAACAQRGVDHRHRSTLE